MKKSFIFSLLCITVVASCFFTSCKKLKGMSKGNLEFSSDTVVFDTVFTTIGSTTKQFKIYNKDNKEITVDEVELVGGTASPFRMNLDGAIGTTFSNLKIPSGDSLFCFVEVTLNVNGGVLPLIVEDSIRFRTNGQDQYVKLAVWGQDMYYHYSNFGIDSIDYEQGTWANDKPHVIYGAAVVDSATTLNIPAGTQIYLHKNSILYNYKGTLNINGTQGNEVVLQGDRLEAEYDNVAGQYYGIYFHQSRPSVIDYCIIKNATAGIHVYDKDVSVTGTNLTVTNTIINNAASYGMFLFAGPQVEVENTLIHSNGVHAVIVLQGADFVFTHCDLLGYGAGDYTTPAVGIRNYYVDADGVQNIGQINQGEFRNCVIFGYDEDQIAIDTVQPGGVNINIDFKNCLVKTTLSSSSDVFSSCIFNQNPAFLNVGEKDFDFTSNSSALNGNGSVSFALPSDITGVLRNSPPDIGCYEN